MKLEFNINITSNSNSETQPNQPQASFSEYFARMSLSSVNSWVSNGYSSFIETSSSLAQTSFESISELRGRCCCSFYSKPVIRLDLNGKKYRSLDMLIETLAEQPGLTSIENLSSQDLAPYYIPPAIGERSICGREVAQVHLALSAMHKPLQEVCLAKAEFDSLDELIDCLRGYTQLKCIQRLFAVRIKGRRISNEQIAQVYKALEGEFSLLEEMDWTYVDFSTLCELKISLRKHSNLKTVKNITSVEIKGKLIQNEQVNEVREAFSHINFEL